MLYVLLFLVVALALVCGAFYAMLKLSNAEYRAELSRLNCMNRELEAKVMEMSRFAKVKEGLK